MFDFKNKLVTLKLYVLQLVTLMLCSRLYRFWVGNLVTILFKHFIYCSLLLFILFDTNITFN